MLWAVVEDEQVAAPMGGWMRHRDEAAARVAEAAGPEFDRGYSEGRELTLDDAVSSALEYRSNARGVAGHVQADETGLATSELADGSSV